MDDTLDEGRIEIELTSNEPARRHRRATQRAYRAPLVEPAAPTEPPLVTADVAEPAAPPPGRNRLVGIAAGAGVAGLLVGWLAGNAGGDGGTLEQAAPVTTAAEAASAPPPSFADDPSLVEPDEPVLTTAPERRSRVATTTQPRVEIESHLLDLDPRLLGLPYEIVTAGSSGELEFINLASSTITIIDGPARGDSGVLFAGDGWTLVPSSSTADKALLYDGADLAPRWVDGGSPWGALGLPGSATLWVPDDSAEMHLPGRMIEVTPEFEPTGASVAVPGRPVLLDSAGNFIVPAAGGTYVASEAGITRLTSGRLVALGPTVALAEECDEQFTCKYLVIDRASSERRDLPGLVRGAPLDPVSWWGQGGESISPDGRVALVLLPSYENQIGVGGYMKSQRLASVDLETGRTTPLTEEDGFIQSVVRWTADSQFAFFMSNGEVFAYVAATGEVLAAGPENRPPMGPTAFEVRPSVGTSLLERDRAADGTAPVDTPSAAP